MGTSRKSTKLMTSYADNAAPNIDADTATRPGDRLATGPQAV